MVVCPNHQGNVLISDLRSCRCGIHGCVECFDVSRVEGFEDEYFCSPACETISLQATLNARTKQLEAAIRDLQTEYDVEIQPLVKRMAELYLRKSRK